MFSRIVYGEVRYLRTAILYVFDEPNSDNNHAGDCCYHFLYFYVSSYRLSRCHWFLIRLTVGVVLPGFVPGDSYHSIASKLCSGTVVVRIISYTICFSLIGVIPPLASL